MPLNGTSDRESETNVDTQNSVNELYLSNNVRKLLEQISDFIVFAPEISLKLFLKNQESFA